MSSHNPYQGWNAYADGCSQTGSGSGANASSGRTSQGGASYSTQQGTHPYAASGASRSGGSSPYGHNPYSTTYGAGVDGSYGAQGPDHDMSAQEFAQLCRSIEQSVSQFARAVGKGIGEAGGALGEAVGKCQRSYQQARGQRGQSQGQSIIDPKAVERQRLAAIKARFRSSAGLTTSGVLMTTFGSMLTLLFGGLLTAAAFVPAASVAVEAALCGLLAVLTGLSAWMLVSGVRRLGLSKRFKSFRRVFGEREVCNISELAAQLRTSEAKVLSQSRRLLKHGLLPQGHIDDEGTCLMVTDNSYQAYRRMQQAQAQRLLEQQQTERDLARLKTQSSSDRTQLSGEAQAFVEQGEDFSRQLRDLDARIADVDVSAKIVAIEEVLQRLLDRVRDEPESMHAMGRLMDYYLPTTVKLLEAYDSLEDQPVRGGTIESSRKEIEQTLDVLRGAFKKMLDESFQDLSIDVSSDISVLHAVLAQEGLTENPFDQRGKAGKRNE